MIERQAYLEHLLRLKDKQIIKVITGIRRCGKSTLLDSYQQMLLDTLENVVYLELLRRGYQVFIGKVDEFEVDFVAMNQEGIIYFQVAASTREASTLERELRSLQKIADHYPKFILTLDEDPDADYDGIRRIHALDWLVR